MMTLDVSGHAVATDRGNQVHEPDGGSGCFGSMLLRKPFDVPQQRRLHPENFDEILAVLASDGVQASRLTVREFRVGEGSHQGNTKLGSYVVVPGVSNDNTKLHGCVGGGRRHHDLQCGWDGVRGTGGMTITPAPQQETRP